MRIVVSTIVLFLMLLSGGCAIYEKETTNRGGYLDAVLDDHWMKADSKSMRALRAFAMEVSLARIASVSAKNDSDRQLLAIRIGALTKRFVPIYMCAFNSNPLAVPGAEGDPCFYYDSAMVDYSTGLFDLAMVALPLEDGQKLLNSVTGAFTSPINIVDLLGSLLQIGKDAIKFGRVVGALYRDTIELEVQLWLTTPEIDTRPPPFRVTLEDIAPLAAIYAQRNDDMPAWLAEMAALRARGLEPIPQPKFYYELGALMSYICGLITSDPTTQASCQANLPDAKLRPAPVLGRSMVSFRIGDLVRTPSGVRRAAVVPRATNPPPPPPPVKTSVGNPLTDVERNSVSFEDAKAFQRMLCVNDSGDFGPSGSDTRNALHEFFQAVYYPRDNLAPETIQTDADLRRLRSSQSLFPNCNAIGFASPFEVGVFSRPTDVGGPIDPMKNVEFVASAMTGTKPDALHGTSFSAATLAAVHGDVVPDLRDHFALPGPKAIDLPLFKKIAASRALQRGRP